MDNPEKLVTLEGALKHGQSKPVSLDCLCVIAPSNVTSFSGLSMFDCPFQCNQFLWIVHV
jgi:hypothetical protein